MASDLMWRPFSVDDLDALYGLIDTIQTHDGEHERTTRADLDTVAGRPWLDLSKDSLVGLDSEGVPRAWGRTGFRPGETAMVTVNLMGGVDPQWRGRGYGRHILTWQAVRALANATGLRNGTDVPAQIGGFVEDHLDGKRRLFEAAGFAASRKFSELRLTIAESSLALPKLPKPLRLVAFDDSTADRIRIARNITFAHHWGFSAASSHMWAAELDDESFRPELSAAIIDPTAPDEPAVAHVLNCEYEHDWDEPDKREGYIDYLGVVPAWRSQGLASYLLTLSAARFAERGHRYAALGVDTENSTGALRLYESLGYQLVHGTTYFSKRV